MYIKSCKKSCNKSCKKSCNKSCKKQRIYNMKGCSKTRSCCKYGKKTKRNKSIKKRTGGGLVTNMGRDFIFNVKSAANSYNGVPAPTNPLPYIQFKQ